MTPDTETLYAPISRPFELLEKIKTNYRYCTTQKAVVSIRTNKPVGGGSSGRDGKYKRLCVRHDSKLHFLRIHHVAWFLYYGAWPEKPIDHITNNPADTDINNLVETTQTENLKRRHERQKWLSDNSNFILDSEGLPY